MASSSWQAFRRLCTAFSVWLCSFHSLEAISGVQANRFYVLRLYLMILPTIITLSESALRSVPHSYYEGALALGADHERCVMHVVLPAAASGILASVVLAIGRAIGETMAVIMIAGNQVKMPSAISDGVRTMTANIVLEMGYAADLHRGALIGTACALFVFILIVNFVFSALKRKGSNG